MLESVVKRWFPSVRVNGLWLRLLVVLCLYAGLFFSVFEQMLGQWSNNPNYSHGFLVPVVSGYLVWERRHMLRALPVQPSRWGALALLAGLLLLVVGVLGAELFLQNASTVVVLGGLVWLLCGAQQLRAVAFPLAFLMFYVPLPAIVLNQVAFPLQLLAARSAAATLSLCDVPVLREGNIIALSGTTLEVAEACSGIRSLQALVALATVYAYFAHQSLYKRAILIALSLPTAVVSNALRVSGTGLIAHYYGVETAQGFYHTFAGWLVFVVAFALLVLASTLLARLPEGPVQREAVGSQPGASE
jgi:exosortase A